MSQLESSTGKELPAIKTELSTAMESITIQDHQNQQLHNRPTIATGQDVLNQNSFSASSTPSLSAANLSLLSNRSSSTENNFTNIATTTTHSSNEDITNNTATTTTTINNHPKNSSSSSIPPPQSSQSLAIFKLTDFHPRRQRRCLAQLRRQQLDLIEANVIVPDSVTEKLRREIRKDVPKMRSKDLDLPFKRQSTSRLSKMLGGSSVNSVHVNSSNPTNNALTPPTATLVALDSTPSNNVDPTSAASLSGRKSPSANTLLLSPRLSVSNKTPMVAFDMIKLAISDGDQERAERLIMQLPQSLLKKKRPFECNWIFLLAMAKRMERLALILLDRGFPADVNSPIFTMKPTPKNFHNIPFKINASLFPSYFTVAVAMGFETLVKFMIKLGAKINQTWYGLTPLHIATSSSGGKPNFSLVQILLDYGADPWIGVFAGQLELLVKLKENSCNLDPDRKPNLAPQYPYSRRSNTRQQQQQPPIEPVIPIALLSIPQRPVHLYNVSQKAPVVDLNELGDLWRQDKFILPVAFAVSVGHRPTVLAILQRMVQLKPRKPRSLSTLETSATAKSSFSSVLPRAVSNTSVSAANHFIAASISNSSLGKDTNGAQQHRALLNPPQKDSVSLLIQQDLEMTVYLLKSGVVDLFQTDPRGANALHLAVRVGNIDLVQVLLHFDNTDGDLINSRGENGWTSLHEAISRGHVELFRTLIKKGADPDIKNSNGDTPRDLGQKLGISLPDLDQVWFGGAASRALFSSSTSEFSISSPTKSSSTILPGTVTTDLIVRMDPRLSKLLSSPLFEEKKKGSILLDLASSPLLWKSSSSNSTTALSPGIALTLTEPSPIIPISGTSGSTSPLNTTSNPTSILEFAAGKIPAQSSTNTATSGPMKKSTSSKLGFPKLGIGRKKRSKSNPVPTNESDTVDSSDH